MTIIDWRPSTVRTSSAALHVRAAGDPSRPTIVLVHGYPDASVVWDDVAARLAASHHVVTYDVRGMGHSAAPTGPHPYRLQHLADDLFAVIDAVSPDAPAHVVGHDWGSIQSWEAVTDPERSHRIASYTTISGPCLDHVGHAMRARLRRPTPGRLRRVLSQGVRSTYIAFLYTPGISTVIWRLGADRAFLRFLERAEGVSVDGRHTTLAADGRTGVHLYRANIVQTVGRPRERRTDVPVQLMSLTGDRYVTAVLLEDLEQWVPHLTRVSLDARHWAPRTHPDEVSTLIAEHVARTDRTDRTATTEAGTETVA
ncbi:MAG: alpha/beta fold hydrolase [Acidimicrobiales bacterium]